MTGQFVAVGDVLLADERWVRGDRDSVERVSVGRSYDVTYTSDDIRRKYGGDDPSRVGKEYVVVRANEEGGGQGMGRHDTYPDGWHVTARRLRADGSYDPEGETVTFYQSGAFSCRIDTPKIVRKMRVIPMSFV